MVDVNQFVTCGGRHMMSSCTPAPMTPMPTAPRNDSHGSIVTPNAESSEYRPGPVPAMPAATAMNAPVYSQPCPGRKMKKPFFACATTVATTMTPIVAAAARGVSRPTASAIPAVISVPAASTAATRPLRIPIDANHPAVPATALRERTLFHPCSASVTPKYPRTQRRANEIVSGSSMTDTFLLVVSNDVGAIDADRLKLLRPYVTDLRRVGPKADGGYLVPARALESADALLSVGISTDWAFESEFAIINPSARIVMYDRSSGVSGFVSSAIRQLSVRQFPWRRRLRLARKFMGHAVRFDREKRRYGFVFHRRWIVDDARDRRRERRLSDALSDISKYEGIIVKIDVEGSEYSLSTQLHAWVKEHGEKCVALLIEFHEVGERLTDIEQFIDNMANRYRVVHLHVNNYGPISGVPGVLELTFCPLKWCSEDQRDILPISGLDFPNNPDALDPIIRFADNQLG